MGKRTQGDTTMHVATSYGTGKVHAATQPVRLPFHKVLACSGRAVEGAVITDRPVDCASCLRKEGK